MLLMADFRAIDCMSPAALVTVGDLTGFGVEVRGGGSEGARPVEFGDGCRSDNEGIEDVPSAVDAVVLTVIRGPVCLCRGTTTGHRSTLL
jgi:hypothetical protein